MSDTDVLGLQGKIKQHLCEQDRRNAIRNSFANEFTWSQEIENCMQTHFNFSSYIGKQQEGINATLCGRDVLVNTHTSSGKSLIYVVPGIIERGVTVVLFPTIALMESQMVNLRDFGITDIACLNNNTTAEARVGIYHSVRSQTVRYFFMTPEMFIMNSEVEQELTVLYRRNQLCRIVIDEAHLIDEYRNFREAYVEMGKFIKKFKTVPVLALTATATPDVVKKIQTSLLFEKGHVYITSEDFDRSNLHYQVIRCDSAFNEQIKVLIETLTREQKGNSGIVYARRRNDCDKITEALQEQGFSCMSNHSKISPSCRTAINDDWHQGKLKIMVATHDAFGMGVNKSDCRFVFHFHIARSLAKYYQESGRAGRDRLPGKCYVLYSTKQRSKVLRLELEEIMKNSATLEDDQEKAIQKHKDNMFSLRRSISDVNGMALYCESTECRRKILMEAIDPDLHIRDCDNCDNCQRSYLYMDVKHDLFNLIKLVNHTAAQRYTAKQLINAWRGSKAKNSNNIVALTNNPFYGSCKLNNKDAERIMEYAILHGYFEEMYKKSKQRVYFKITCTQKPWEDITSAKLPIWNLYTECVAKDTWYDKPPVIIIKEDDEPEEIEPFNGDIYKNLVDDTIDIGDELDSTNQMVVDDTDESTDLDISIELEDDEDKNKKLKKKKQPVKQRKIPSKPAIVHKAKKKPIVEFEDSDEEVKPNIEVVIIIPSDDDEDFLSILKKRKSGPPTPKRSKN